MSVAPRMPQQRHDVAIHALLDEDVARRRNRLEELVDAIAAARDIFVEESVNRYVVALLRHTRGNRHLALGASPRSGIALLRLAKARALVERRAFVTPDDIREMATPVLSHRLLLAPEARSAGLGPEDVVREALEGTPVPV